MISTMCHVGNLMFHRVGIILRPVYLRMMVTVLIALPCIPTYCKIKVKSSMRYFVRKEIIAVGTHINCPYKNVIIVKFKSRTKLSNSIFKFQRPISGRQPHARRQDNALQDVRPGQASTKMPVLQGRGVDHLLAARLERHAADRQLPLPQVLSHVSAQEAAVHDT